MSIDEETVKLSDSIADLKESLQRKDQALIDRLERLIGKYRKQDGHYREQILSEVILDLELLASDLTVRRQ